jgi:hypothetical protein
VSKDRPCRRWLPAFSFPPIQPYSMLMSASSFRVWPPFTPAFFIYEREDRVTLLTCGRVRHHATTSLPPHHWLFSVPASLTSPLLKCRARINRQDPWCSSPVPLPAFSPSGAWGYSASSSSSWRPPVLCLPELASCSQVRFLR